MILELYILLVLLTLIQLLDLTILDRLELDPQLLLELLRKEAVNKILPILLDPIIKVIKGQHIGTLNQKNMQNHLNHHNQQIAQIYWNDEWNLNSK